MKLKLVLTLLGAGCLCLPAFAQDPVPPTAPAGAGFPAASGQAPVLLELFSSQACPFCPEAEELLGRLAEDRGIIALNCHIDYFDVKTGSLALPVCSQRQNDYAKLLGSGPVYTPQLVVGGQSDVVGYEEDKVRAAIARARKAVPLSIEEKSEGVYGFSLKQTDLKGAPVRLWLALYDRPREVMAAEGGNAGKDVVYTNIVSALLDLGGWNGEALMRALTPELQERHAGFAIVAQNTATGEIVAAGSFSLLQEEPRE